METDSSKILDLAAPCFFVRSFGIALLSNGDRPVDEDLNELILAGQASCQTAQIRHQYGIGNSWILFIEGRLPSVQIHNLCGIQKRRILSNRTRKALPGSSFNVLCGTSCPRRDLPSWAR